MREIKFRGYSSGWHTWVYGDLQTPIKDNNLPFIRQLDEDEWFSVEEESVGQYTGFLDKNKKEIYEGDIVKAGDGFSNIVEFDKEMGCWVIVDTSKSLFYHKKPLWTNKNCEVIGNCYEAYINS